MLGASIERRNSVARPADVEDAAAATMCWMSWTSRVAGLVRRSLVKAERVQYYF